MGTTKIAVRLLLEEHRARPFHGSILQLGRQAIGVNRAELDDLRQAHGLPRAPRPHAAPEPDEPWDDRAFFRELGFDTVESLDVSAGEGATHVADLNHPVPAHLHGRFDFIFDGGTLEHVFHVPNALASVHAMLKPGGRAVHLTPASNHIDHGFYSFSPVLFHDWYSANGYRVDAAYLITFDLDWSHGSFTVYEYAPSHALHMLGSSHAWDGVAAASFFVVTKQPHSTGDQIPIQYHYRVHAQHGVEAATTGQAPSFFTQDAAARLRGAIRLKRALAQAPLVRDLFRTEAYGRLRAWLMKNFVVKRNFPRVHARF